ncbi:MAG: thiamine pyrophosphate-dependent enzyme, partial [Pseudomonadota bacterium]
DADEAQTYTHQVLDQTQVFRPITKASFTLTAGAAHVIADKALAIATQPQQGPVHIDVPISVAVAAATDGKVHRSTAVPVIPNDTVLDNLSEQVKVAERVAIIAGLDAISEAGASALAKCAEALGIPIVTTYKGKGLVPEYHDLCLGGAGLSPKADAILLPMLATADLIIGLGYDPIEMRTGWRNFLTDGQKMIDITTVPNTHYMHQGSTNIIADPVATLEALCERLANGTGPLWPPSEVQATKAKLAQAFPHDEVWGPAAIIDECRKILPPDTLATADSGAHRILLSQMWECYEPRGLMQSSALCTMGCAVPLAMGAEIASPDRKVVSFSGDAGFLMVAGELSTAKELGLKTIFLIFVDASLALIEKKQRERQLPNAGVDFGTHDFAAVGRAFGGVGHRVTSRIELQTALDAALRADTFTVIAAHIERGAYDGRI